MTYYQVLALVVAGPIGLQMLLHLAMLFTKHGQSFNLAQGALLLVCITIILLAFLGAK